MAHARDTASRRWRENLLKVLKSEQLHALVWVSGAQTWPCRKTYVIPTWHLFNSFELYEISVMLILIRIAVLFRCH